MSILAPLNALTSDSSNRNVKNIGGNAVSLELTCIEEESFTCGLGDPIELTFSEREISHPAAESELELVANLDRNVEFIVTKVYFYIMTRFAFTFL